MKLVCEQSRTTVVSMLYLYHLIHHIRIGLGMKSVCVSIL